MDSNQQATEASGPRIRRGRKCPSCQTAIVRLNLSAFSLPIEQSVIPWLVGINREAEWSVRAFGSTDINEFQFLGFTNICLECGHISWWDLAVEELENALNDPNSEFKIAWNYEPAKLMQLERALTVEKKWIAQKLLEQMAIAKDGNAKSE